ncbi:pyruvate dehydrogenase complex dihydrolipoamide acetyltransferase [Hymenobacter fastidiosus]|uniref:Acetyltransferase component of pyruvate dehydrogenase complex n=2 Tax=Hymenobacter fastidiosus TaxID=486264 RepID=A0ABP7SFU6_9BACT
MPKMSDTMTEGVIASWLKKVGDKVKAGDIIAEVETDKATMELENYEDGTLLHIGPKEGDAVAVDGVLAIVGKEGEDISALLNGAPTAPAPAAAAPAAEAAPAPAAQPAPTPAPAVAPAAAPAAPAAPAPAPVVGAAPAAPAGNGKKATVIRMPKMSDTMTEGTIASWLKKVGDKVKSGDILAEVETDKATMELENYDDGTLLYIGPKDGEAVAVDGILAIIGEEGADVQALLGGQSGGSAAPAAPAPAAAPETAAAEAAPAAATPAAPAAAGAPQSATVTQPGGRIFASPLAKSIAKDKGIDLSSIKGSGENGRIVSRDLESAQPGAAPATQPAAAPAAAAQPAPAAPAAPAAAPTAEAPAPQPRPQDPKTPASQDYTDTPVSQMRKVIARRLSESLFTAPHFYLTMEINMDRAMEVRTQLNTLSPVKLSFNDLVVKASAVALRQHPVVNSSWLGDKIRQNHVINIGVAVAVDEGLLVPVVRNADGKGLSQIATEVKALAEKAKTKKLQPAEWEGSTFTISNLGMFGIEEFTAIINPPDACILAVGGIKQTAVVKDGQLAIGNIMKVTLSCDHRVVDGATGAAFLQTLKALLEDPMRMLI